MKKELYIKKKNESVADKCRIKMSWKKDKERIKLVELRYFLMIEYEKKTFEKWIKRKENEIKSIFFSYAVWGL